MSAFYGCLGGVYTSIDKFGYFPQVRLLTGIFLIDV